MRMKHSPGLDPIPQSVWAEARVLLDKNPDVEEILNAGSAADVRTKIFESYKIDPAHPLSHLHSAVLTEAVDRWNKRQIEKSTE